MNKDVILNIIIEGQEEILNVQLYERHHEFEEVGKYVLVGVRQAGKSYLLYQRAKQLLKKKHSVKEFVYINFDDERLLGMKAEDFDLILQAYSSHFREKPIFFFDEIQNIDGWEHFARRLANQKYLVFITGSNAKMLSRDISTTLGGRYFEEMVYPYSFSEYLGARGIKLTDNWEYGSKKNEIRLAFKDYFNWGGFPELLLYNNKRHWLNGLYEKILLGDIMLRNNVKNENAMRLALKRLAENVKQPVAYNRLANMIKSANIVTSTSSIIDYVGFAKDACLIFTINNFASQFAERESVKKHYFSDNGLLNIFLMDANTSLLENICAINLYKKYENNLYYYNKNIEVDFFVPDEKMGIQVSYSIDNEDTYKREIGALEKMDKVFPMKKMLLVTYDDERLIPLESGKTIEVVPVWKWLLRDVD